LIFGASTRAAAQSAIRAGYRPTCADQFADEDLREIAEVLALDRYPEGLVEAVADFPACPWMYTGALENRPAVLEQLAALRPLWGNPADVVRAVRDPFRLHGLLDRRGLPALAVRPIDDPPPQDGRWMLKPHGGSAGRGIFRWESGAAELRQLGEPYYFQQGAVGRPISGLFLAAGRTTTLIGATEQWIGRPELSAEPFTYCGSTGPIDLPNQVSRQVAETGERIASELGLRGLFGVDFLLEHEIAWPTEVNPRYTASVEIYERACDMPLLEWHAQACRTHQEPSQGQSISERFRTVLESTQQHFGGQKAAKAIVYAPFDLRVPDLVTIRQSHAFAASQVEIADRPAVGLPVSQGSPVCTLITSQAGTRSLAVFEGALSALAVEFEHSRF
jgi:uncharacterized protein